MRPPLVFLFAFISVTEINTTKASALIHKSIELCGSETDIVLTGDGESASTIITLSETDHAGICKLKITAPSNYLVNMQFMETSTELQRALQYNNSEKYPPCMMSVFLPENRKTAVWKGDPCSNDVLSEIDLLTPQFRIVWNPPNNPIHTKGRKFILTAVGTSEVCIKPDQHICMKIGWKPHLCISKHLICDGNQNCPKGASKSDEDETLCKSHLSTQRTLKQLVEILKKFKPSDDLMKTRWIQGALLEDNSTTMATPKKSLLNWREWQELKKAEDKLKKVVNQSTENNPRNSVDSISEVLSSYGPWGYLMLGMLICGTVLMFCGLWECCFRKPKPLSETPSQTQPTTVLIINQQQQQQQQQDDAINNSDPPNYEDLDQPPSYSALFPNYKFNNGQQSRMVVEIEVPEIVYQQHIRNGGDNVPTSYNENGDSVHTSELNTDGECTIIQTNSNNRSRYHEETQT